MNAWPCTCPVRERTEELDHQWDPRDVRFAYYTRPIKSDFRQHRASAAGTNCWGPPVKKFLCEHPDWRASCTCSKTAACRTWRRVDAGDFLLKERWQLVLKWDRWPAVTLQWNEQDHVYRDRTLRLTLREILPEGRNGAPDD